MEIFINEIFNIPDRFFVNRLAKIIQAIQQNEELPPIIVRKATKGYWLLDGAHRIKANMILGKKSINAEIKETFR